MRGDKQEYVNKDGLKNDYFFSDKWIALLGEPDKVVPNPRYRSGSPMQFWLESRVVDFIKDHDGEYQEHLRRRSVRSEASKLVCDRKRRETLDWAEDVGIRVHKASIKAISEDSSRFFMERGCYDRDLGDRQILNQVRHDYTNYHALLEKLKGRIGRLEAYRILRRRVNEEACRKYGIPCTPENTGDEQADDAYVSKFWGEPANTPDV